VAFDGLDVDVLDAERRRLHRLRVRLRDTGRDGQGEGGRPAGENQQ
jgi:hypothetical protein